MSKIPENLLYTKDHEWVKYENGIATIGITDFAQGELGDVVFVQLPDLGSKATQGGAFGTIEAVKAVADLYSPISGEVIEVNSALGDHPETINSSPYDSGWIVKVKASNFDSEKSHLMNSTAYTELTTA